MLTLQEIGVPRKIVLHVKNHPNQKFKQICTHSVKKKKNKTTNKNKKKKEEIYKL